MLISIRIFHSNFQRTQKVQPKSQGRGHKKSNPKWGAYFVRLSHDDIRTKFTSTPQKRRCKNRQRSTSDVMIFMIIEYFDFIILIQSGALFIPSLLRVSKNTVTSLTTNKLKTHFFQKFNDSFQIMNWIFTQKIDKKLEFFPLFFLQKRKFFHEKNVFFRKEN